MGRFTISEMLGIPTGAVVVLLIAMALSMFFGAEISERIFGRKEKINRSNVLPKSKPKMAGAAILFGAAILIFVIGQPDAHAKWTALADTAGVELNNEEPFIHPGEVVEWKEDSSVFVRILDVRSEGDFNQFHIMGSKRVTQQQVFSDEFIKRLSTAPDNTLYFVVSNGESDATSAWKVLKSTGIANVYVIEGGINNWLHVYPPDPCIAKPIPTQYIKHEEQFAFAFNQAVGDSCYSAHPDAKFKEPPTDCFLKSHPELIRRPANSRDSRNVPFAQHAKPKFKRKVKMQKKQAVKGGCG